MVRKHVSPEDYAAILNLMSLYQHLVDEGDERAWADLFTEDGEFLGLTDGEGNPADLRGREALASVPRLNRANFAGKMRHNISALTADYGDNRDEAFARYYMVGTVSRPGEPVTIALQVDVKTQLVRVGGEWRIRSNRFTPV